MSTTRPLRQDAARNRERLVHAAHEVFRRRGLGAPLEDVAREAGVSIGTLYNRFPGRSELVDAAMGPLAQRAVAMAERDARAADPWQGFASFVEHTCALCADHRGYADMYRSGIPDTPVVTAAKKRLGALKTRILNRAKDAGVLRADIETTDVVLIVWAIAGTSDATRDIAPEYWRRQLALVLDGLRPAAAHALPGPALTLSQLRKAGPA